MLSVGVSGLLDGLDVTIPGSGYTTSPLAAASTDGFVTVPYHGLTNGSAVTFSAVTGTTAILENQSYYAVSASPTQFKLATASTGSPLSITEAFTGVVLIPAPSVSFSSSQGLDKANASVIIGVDGGIAGASVLSAGTGATTSGVTATVVGGAGTGAAIGVRMAFSVASITAATSGSGFLTPPSLGFRPTDGGALAVAAVTNGGIAGVTVLAGGRYSSPPTAVVESPNARAIAVISQAVAGKYKCCFRYLDDTPITQRGPMPSSISDFAEAFTASEAKGLAWSWSNAGAEARAHRVELWRTTADQALVLYRVAILDKVNGVLPNSYSDTLSDSDLLDPSRADFGIMPIVLPSGQLNARRFTPPPTKCAVACVFQDRAWYTLDTSGASPNSLWYSEIDEPESVPEVNEIILQENATDSDAIVGIVPFGAALLVVQRRHLYKLQYVAQPIIDSSILLVAYRGALNDRCVDVYDGVAFIADAYGLYAFDGQQQQALSIPVDDYWREGVIDFSKSDSFHVRVNPLDRVVRFYYCKPTDAVNPTRALCYCIATKAWWEEVYESPRTASVPAIMAGGARVLTAGAGEFMKQVPGALDTGASSMPYEYRTGNFPLANERSRSVGLVYTPSLNHLQVRLHYNGSPSPRANAISSDRGDGFVTMQGSTAASLNMASDRSALGSAPGFARAYFSGRVDDRSAGGDRHSAIAVAGAKTGSEPVRLHAVIVEGVTQ